MFPSVFLFFPNVLSKDSSEFSISCLDVLLIRVDFILPMISRVVLGLKVYGCIISSLMR